MAGVGGGGCTHRAKILTGTSGGGGGGMGGCTQSKDSVTGTRRGLVGGLYTQSKNSVTRTIWAPSTGSRLIFSIHCQTQSLSLINFFIFVLNTQFSLVRTISRATMSTFPNT